MKKRKPSAEGIDQILNELGWPREHTIYVGDSNDDMQAGDEAGLRTFAAQWMAVVQDKHYQIEPEQMFSDVDEFKKFVWGQLAER